MSNVYQDRLANKPSAEFIRMARDLVAARRKKLHHSMCGELARRGWSMLGAGHFGEGWCHEDYPQFAVKISGPAGWGETCEGFHGSKHANRRFAGRDVNGRHRHAYKPRPDSWPMFAAACIANPAENLPVFYHLEYVNQHMTWAVMEQLQDYPREIRRSFATQQDSWANALAGTVECPTWLLPVRRIKQNDEAVRIDLHGGNIRMRGDVPVIIDPFSFKD